MKKIVIPTANVRWNLLLASFLFLILLCEQANAQRIDPKKNDYIVLGDTAQSDGYIQDFPVENNTVIFYKRMKNHEYQKYSVKDVSEFFVKDRTFYRRNISFHGNEKLVFLQKIPHPKEDQIQLWKLTEDKDYYFLETAGSLSLLENDSYQQVFRDLLNNPILDPLIDITSLEEYSLIYLMETSESIAKPRTFNRTITFSAYLGYSFNSNHFKIDNSLLAPKVSGGGPTFGVNLEFFVNKSRNLSINLSPSLSLFDNQELLNTNKVGNRLETDYFLEYTALNFPILGRYYLDIQPNKWRAYGEFGYNYGLFNYKKLGFFQAHVEGSAVTTTVGEFELEKQYYGLIGGFGIEKYLKDAKSFSLGFRSTSLQSTNRSEKFVTMLGFIGYKF